MKISLSFILFITVWICLLEQGQIHLEVCKAQYRVVNWLATCPVVGPEVTFDMLFFYERSLFEDKRCKCVCPNTSVVNGSDTDRRIYIGNVPGQDCNCETVVIPMTAKINDKEFCPRCSCHFETRNTTTIRIVVIIVIWIISLLVIYMLFLMCLDPLLNKRATTYQEHTDEDTTEVESTPMPSTSYAPSGTNVLNRVGHQQFKWKKQVQEQRRNIYDRHTMLN